MHAYYILAEITKNIIFMTNECIIQTDTTLILDNFRKHNRFKGFIMITLNTEKDLSHESWK